MYRKPTANLRIYACGIPFAVLRNLRLRNKVYICGAQLCQKVSTRSVGMNLPGSNSVVFILAMDGFVLPCTNEVSLLSRIVNVVPLIRPQTTSHSVPGGLGW